MSLFLRRGQSVAENTTGAPDHVWHGAVLLAAFLASGLVLRAEGGEIQNSLGMKFRAVSVTRVQFAVWETRVGDWKAYLLESRRPPAWLGQPAFSQTDDHPAVNITLAEAGDFCEWLTRREREAGTLTGAQRYRLPTNAEWDAAVGLSPRTEAAGAAGDLEPHLYPWGTDWPPPRRAGNYCRDAIEGGDDDGFKFTAPVGRFDPSPDGLYDLGGNAWEWTVDPGPEANSSACLRGGSWMYWRRECLESSYQLRVKPGVRAPSIGFRCVMEDDAVVDRDRRKIAADDELKRRELVARPKVSYDEVQSVLSQLSDRRRGAVAAGATNSEARAANSLAPNAHEAAAPGRMFTNSLGITMLPVSGASILLGEHEVRVADFNACAVENGWPRRTGAASDGGLAEPVTGVTWQDAVSFCLWLTQRERARDLLPPGAVYRLPALAEWRAAVWDQASGTASGSDYPWGASWPPPGDHANVNRTGGLSRPGGSGHLLPVKSLRPNARGFFDLVGNAAEWCQDVRPAAPAERVYCGGSWSSNTPEDLRAGNGQRISIAAVRADLGFRLALDFRPTEKISFQPSPATVRRR
jgi:formylglycine-generating enzyme required for sulfatase activity